MSSTQFSNVVATNDWIIIYNVALDFHPWILNINLGTFHPLVHFNVAMDFHPWIHVFLDKYILAISELQCCHGFSSMDTSPSKASATRYPYRFNVAIDFHPWIPDVLFRSWDMLCLLQCCHGFSSMDTGTDAFDEMRSKMLQCCHRFSSMDTQKYSNCWFFRNRASMLPWIFIHGYC